jgi:O-antigen biosynthesis protein
MENRHREKSSGKKGCDKALVSFADLLFPKNTGRRAWVKFLHRSMAALAIKLREPGRTLMTLSATFFPSDTKGGNFIRCLFSFISPKRAQGSKNLRTVTDLISAAGHTSIESEFLSISPVDRMLTFQEEHEPIISIIIMANKIFPYTWNCLRSINDHVRELPYEIIVVEKAGENAELKVTDICSHIRPISQSGNEVFLEALNRAVSLAKGPSIIFLHNDCEVTGDAINELFFRLQQQENAGAIVGKIVSADNRLLSAGGYLRGDKTPVIIGRHADPEKPDYSYVREVDFSYGECIIVKRELLEQAGCFDTTYGSQDLAFADLCCTIKSKGHGIFLEPASIIRHYHNAPSAGIKDRGTGAGKAGFLKKGGNQELLQFSESTAAMNTRHHGAKKKTILVADTHVPTPDRDTGSRNTLHYLMLFVEWGFNVVFFPENLERTEPYTRALQQMGIEVLYGSWYDYDRWKNWIKRAPPIDYACLHRPEVALKCIDFLREKTQAKILYFGHDLHYLREMRRADIEKNDEAARQAGKLKGVECAIFKKADVIYYPSTYEVSCVKQNCPLANVKLLPLFITDYMAMQKKVIDFSSRHGILFVGSFGHPPNLDGLDWFIQSIFPDIVRAIPDIEFHIAGSRMPERISDLKSDNISVEGCVDEKRLRELYGKVRLSITPLQYGAGLKGKILESLYYGIPVITTSIGAEGIPEAEKVLIVADGAQAFADALIKAYNEVTTLGTMASRYDHYLDTYFSKKRAREILAEDLSPS